LYPDLEEDSVTLSSAFYFLVALLGGGFAARLFSVLARDSVRDEYVTKEQFATHETRINTLATLVEGLREAVVESMTKTTLQQAALGRVERDHSQLVDRVTASLDSIAMRLDEFGKLYAAQDAKLGLLLASKRGH
jgi:hypothetical protein